MIGADTTFLVHLEIRETPEHSRAHDWLRAEIIEKPDTIALVPQTLVEFIHVVTDARRFQIPLTMEQALAKARFWWSAADVRHVFPGAESTALFIDWVARHRLGRKRLLDTFLAATFRAAGVSRIVSGNTRDFAIFGGFELATY